ncbi:hypothetical protein ACIA8E_29115 [Streptomyces sp. NPDC051664]|uniref:hypothetical protein n=1 Tax=Streptomyces sp. NPDC051664 TaxID=3365668 RepID=UPI00378A3ACD
MRAKTCSAQARTCLWDFDTAPLPAVGRLTAEYTLADNVFTTPRDAGHQFSAELRTQLRGVVDADHFHQG